ncbi:MAG: hypothetical protein LBD37_04560 [Treponema sp.]|nr:hypothetical protein [Treponema sp.]
MDNPRNNADGLALMPVCHEGRTDLPYPVFLFDDDDLDDDDFDDMDDDFEDDFEDDYEDEDEDDFDEDEDEDFDYEEDVEYDDFDE